MSVSDQGSGSTSSGVIWVSDKDLWLSEEFDDTHLVFFRPSEETHFLNFLSFGALFSLSLQQASVGELQRRLQEQFSLQEEDLPLSLVENVIHELDEAGLIGPVELDADINK